MEKYETFVMTPVQVEKFFREVVPQVGDNSGGGSLYFETVYFFGDYHFVFNLTDADIAFVSAWEKENIKDK